MGVFFIIFLLLLDYHKIKDPYQSFSESWKAVTPTERAADPLVDDLVRDTAIQILDDVT